MKNVLTIAISLAAALLAPLGARAADIDLFLGPGATEAGAPNVLFIVDNTANWGPIFDREMKALSDVFKSLPSVNINVGLLMFTETGGADKGIDGGYVRAAIRPFTDATAEKYSDMMLGLDELGDRSNSGKSSKAMAEAYHYFAGLAPKAGNKKAKTDYEGNAYNTKSCCEYSLPVWALPGNALSVSNGGKNGTLYSSPIKGGSCGGNYIIFIGNGPAQDSSKDNGEAGSWLDELNGDVTEIPLDSAKAQENWMDEWARFMKDSDLDITSFTVDINANPDTGQGPNWTLLLKSVANVGGGEYYDLRGETFDPADLIAAIESALSQILAKNSVFASVALPASTSAQSTFLNQVFIGLFRPDKDAKARWPGNLKQYKLARDEVDDLVKVVDADGIPVVDGNTGFVKECARSFWTPSGKDAYWSFAVDPNDPPGCTVDGSSASSNSPDGPNVEKGGQAYTLRASSPASRVVYTCSPEFGSCTVLTDFKTASAAITQVLLDPNDPTSNRDEMINWARGLDLDDVNENGSNADARPYIHGDVVHSQPVALDYADASDPNDPGPKVVVYYAGNDGMLRAVNGNRSTAIGTPAVPAGHELWAFMPPEFYQYISILRKNTDTVNFPASGPAAAVGGIAKPYGVDGPITAFQGQLGVIEKKIIYAGMRRGGRVLYSFDVTNINSPSLRWKKGCPNLNNDDDCTAGWEDIGQTWSQATVTFAEGFDSGDTPVLIMGGGYDNCEDFDGGNGGANHECDGDAKGNLILVVNGNTGAILTSFETDRGVVGNITAVPVGDYDPSLKYAYATDLGGNVYRISGGDSDTPAEIGGAPPADWIITKIAALGCDDGADDCTANRKFLFGPDAVKIPGTDSIAVLIGSGDREKPLLDYGATQDVQNYFFSMVDQPLIADWFDDDGTCGADLICLDSLTQLSLAGIQGLAEGEALSEKGWRFPLANNEQVVSGALTIADIVNFSTHIPTMPDADSCDTDLGTATTYNLNYQKADGVANNIIGGGLVPTPVGGNVILDDGEIVTFCIGCGGENSSIGGSEPGGADTLTQPKSRVYWNIQQ